MAGGVAVGMAVLTYGDTVAKHGREGLGAMVSIVLVDDRVSVPVAVGEGNRCSMVATGCMAPVVKEAWRLSTPYWLECAAANTHEQQSTIIAVARQMGEGLHREHPVAL